VAGFCECGDEPSGSCATELVRWLCNAVEFTKNAKPELFLCQSSS
jgi:hypothetical protein